MLSRLPESLSPAEHAALDGDAQLADRLERAEAMELACRLLATEALREAEDALQVLGGMARPLYEELTAHAERLIALRRLCQMHGETPSA